jgi:hypothetical protein
MPKVEENQMSFVPLLFPRRGALFCFNDHFLFVLLEADKGPQGNGASGDAGEGG